MNKDKKKFIFNAQKHSANEDYEGKVKLVLIVEHEEAKIPQFIPVQTELLVTVEVIRTLPGGGKMKRRRNKKQKKDDVQDVQNNVNDEI